jgi:hypothetical protein
MKTLKLVILATAISIVGTLTAQVTVTIGSGTATTREIPVTTTRVYTYSQQIFLKSEINRQGSITKIRFYMIENADLSNSNTWKIYMGHVGQSSFSSYTDWIPLTALTQVFSGTVATAPAAGWYEITLNTPFVYNNIQNLVVAIDENNVLSGSFNYYCRVWTPAIANRTIIHASGTNPSPSNPPADATSKTMSIVNQIQLEFLVPNGGDNPTNFSATPFNGSRIDLSWNLNTSNDSVMLAWNTSNQFGTPVNGVNYANGAEIPGGGTVLLTYPVESFRHEGLSDDTPNYYKAWSKASYGGYSTGVTTSATTLCANISPPWIDFFPNIDNNYDTQFPLCWSQAVGYLTDTASFETDPEDYAYPWSKYYFANTETNKPKAPSLEIKGSPSNGYTRSWLLTPAIDLGTEKTMYLQFDIAYTTYGGTGEYIYPSQEGYDDKFAIVISTDRGETWHSANTLRLWDNAGSDYVMNNIPHYRTTETISLAGYSGVVKIGFYGESTVSNVDNRIFIDDVEISSCLKPLAITTSNITTNNATISWEFEGPSGITFDVYYDLSTSIAEPTSATTPTITGIYSTNYQLSGLAHVNEYTYYVRSNGGGGDVGFWQGPYTFETEQIPVTLPYSDGFETWPYGWKTINQVYNWSYNFWDDCANTWTIGTNTAHSGSQSAYVSFANSYSYLASPSTVSLYRDITFPSTNNNYKIKFDWKCNGSYNSSMIVYLIPDSIIPYDYIDIDDYRIKNDTYYGYNFYGSMNWVNETIEILNGDFAGETRRLVFKWSNNNVDGTNTYQPPAAIDNVEVFTFDPLSTNVEKNKSEKEPIISIINKQIQISHLQPHAVISIFNILGQKITQKYTGTKTHEMIDTKSLSGTYIVVINNDERIISRKITVP